MSKNRFEDQVVVITGASSGIGRATALAFAREGARTVLVSRSREKLDLVANEIRPSPGSALVIPADVSSAEAVHEAVRAIVAEHGRIDVLFNNAGKSHVGPTESPDFVEKTRDMFETDFLGTVHVTRAVLPVMRQQRCGHVLNTSSVVGRKSFAGFGGYSSMMHALDAYTGALRQELKGAGIGVSVIHPALTQTPLLADVSPAMPPAFRRLSPITAEEVAEAALSGIHRDAARIVVPWQPRLLMLAEALSPRLGDRFVELLQGRLFSRLVGTFRGTTYHHEATS